MTDDPFHSAVRALRAGDSKTAEALARECLVANPGRADALELLGGLLAQGGRLEEAADVLGRATAVRPDEPVMRTNLGEVLRRLGRPAEAAGHLRTAVAAAPDFPEAYYNLGNALKDLGRRAEAAAAFRRAAELKPGYA